ncbi:MAG: membrane protein insertion efficiency factor YidD [Myxococcales bacterium]|nr:membrane protein insertion efficiency factor YidD [Myxococcales bacterium]MCB9644166.1 membrane protein insertion efficiency factor YidD [Myxococcales bacterium]
MDTQTQGENPQGPTERLMLRAIKFYQTHISPKTPPSCRFQPTCSEYSRQAILRYGWHKGVWLTCCRLGRCHPLHPGGIDPVP